PPPPPQQPPKMEPVEPEEAEPDADGFSLDIPGVDTGGVGVNIG
ncbi:MAG TPA: energy transducer TonB, partial [Alteromonas sp.]|nr:energy transducer TonB [Alteromonas sp.]